MKRWLLLFCLWPVVAQATIFVFDNDSLPKTLTAGYQDDTIRFSGTSVTTSGSGIIVSTSRVLIQGQGDTLFFGTSNGNLNEGIYLSGTGDSCTIRDLVIIHDPGNDGVIEDTLATAAQTTGIWFESPYKANVINCRVVIYGDDGRCMDNSGSGVGLRNCIVDSCRVWNYCYTFTSRHSYDGSAIRLTCRGGAFAAGEWGARIYRTAVLIAPQIGMALFGDGSVYHRGVEIAYCTTFVDHHTTGSQNANQYGILTRFCDGPFSIHDNFIGAGTKYGGSRGIMLENIKGFVADTAKVYNNVIKQWSGPDLENAAGVTRGLRIRNIDGGTSDYLYIHDNIVECIVDSDTLTAHIGTDGFCVNMSYDALVQSTGRFRIENNVFTLRSLSASGIHGAAGHYGIEPSYSGVPPITMQYNKYASDDKIVFLADDYNGYSCHDLTLFKDSLVFLPAADSGINQSDKQTWQVGEAITGGIGNKAMNCWYDTTTGARDTNILLSSAGSTHDLNLVQRIPIAVIGDTGADSIVANVGMKIWNGYNQVVLDDATVPNGDTTFDFRYWRTYGNGAGSDSNFNEFDVWAWSGTDTTKLNDTTIDWKVTCLTIHLAATHGTRAPDTCVAAAPPAESSPSLTIRGTNLRGVILR